MRITRNKAVFFSIEISKELYHVLVFANTENKNYEKLCLLYEHQALKMLYKIDTEQLSDEAKKEYQNLCTFLGQYDDHDYVFFQILQRFDLPIIKE